MKRALLPANFMPRPYRGVSVQTFAGPLTPQAVEATLIGRDAYRRTEFVVLRGEEWETAVVQVGTADRGPLFSPITEVAWVAGPEETAYLIDAEADTASASVMARTARRATTARCVVVEGRYHHVNFIVEPRPLEVRVVEVVPPEPAKLHDMAGRILDADDVLPPIRLILETIDIRALARRHPAARFLLPCRGGGGELPGALDYLDEHPPERDDWVLIGCERSRQVCDWFYGRRPPCEELCPRRLAAGPGPVLLKCCLLERGVEGDGQRVVVPWGANQAEVREALARLGAGPDVS